VEVGEEGNAEALEVGGESANVYPGAPDVEAAWLYDGGV
jgi:hypothetical protein